MVIREKIYKILLLSVWPVIPMNADAQDVLKSEDPVLTFGKVYAVEGVNTDAEESYPLLASNGDFYFVRTLYKENKGGELSGQDVWKASAGKDKKQFSQVTNNLPGINNRGNNAVVGLGNNDNQLYLLNLYSGDESPKSGVAVSHKTTDGWGSPQNLDVPIGNLTGNYYSMHVAAGGKVVFISMLNGSAKEDIYVMIKDGSTWTKPVFLNGINTSGAEISPFYFEKEGILFFASTGHAGAESSDIYYSRKTGDGWNSWSAPVRLDINSSGFDAYFTCSASGDCYFVSTRKSELSDIYHTQITFTYPEPETTVVQVDTTPVAEPETAVIVSHVLDFMSKPVEVHFGFNQTSPVTGESALTDSIVAKLKQFPDIVVEVSGHTDTIGTYEANLYVSKRRAENVKHKLVAAGIAANRITVKYYAYKQPVASNTTAEGRARNRRVEVKYFLQD